MKKVILTKTATVFTTTRDNNRLDDNKSVNSIYGQRKKMQKQYKDLFSALFRIPDRAIQERVIAAINSSEPSNEVYCGKCCMIFSKADRKFTNIGIQTDNVASVPEQSPDSNITNGKVSCTETELSQEKNKTTVETTAQSLDTVEETKKRKRRKRKLGFPQVVKKSQAQMVNQVQPKIKRINTPAITATAATSIMSPHPDALYQDLPHSINDMDMLVDEYLQPNIESSSTYIAQTMAMEFFQAENLENGMLPIHEAIATSEINKFQRQLIVWKHKEIDLNELITDEEQDCLQLAVMCNSLPRIVHSLLSSGLNVNCLDNKGHSIVHLAILNDVDLKTLTLLMERIDLSLLLKLNDDGYTPLHIAVRHDRYAHAEIMLNTIDNRTLSTLLHNRRPLQNSDEDRKLFLEFYEMACDHLDERSLRRFPNNEQMMMAKTVLKRNLLEISDMRSGNTALFSAVENGMEHFIYFLLAHVADPRSTNHCGMNSKSYFTEFGKMMNLSLKIDRTMDKVVEYHKRVFI